MLNLVSSILAALNGNIASLPSGKSINTNYKNVVSFSFKDSDFPPLPSSAIPNLHRVSKIVGSPVPNIIKPIRNE